MADFYICNESHVAVYDSPMNGDRVSVGVQWGYLNRQGRIPTFSYCCCGEADPDNINVHGPSITCRASARKEVEGAVRQFLSQNHLEVTILVREYHNITLTDLEKPLMFSFYGVPGQPEIGVHMSGAYDCFGSPRLEITERDSLLEYAKKVGRLAIECGNGQMKKEFIEPLNVCD